MYTNIRTVESILVAGRTTICMDKESIFGVMELAMKVNMKWIKNKDLVFINGQMAEHMKEIGLVGNNMVQANTNSKMELSKQVNGLMVKDNKIDDKKEDLK